MSLLRIFVAKQYIHVGDWVISMKYIFINDALKVNVIHTEDYAVDDTEYKVPIGIITVYNSKVTLQSTNHLASNSTCRTLERYFQPQLLKLNLPRLTEDYYNGTYFFPPRR